MRLIVKNLSGRDFQFLIYYFSLKVSNSSSEVELSKPNSFDTDLSALVNQSNLLIDPSLVQITG